jgi:hypothetical protein
MQKAKKIRLMISCKESQSYIVKDIVDSEGGALIIHEDESEVFYSCMLREQQIIEWSKELLDLIKTDYLPPNTP